MPRGARRGCLLAQAWGPLRQAVPLTQLPHGHRLKGQGPGPQEALRPPALSAPPPPAPVPLVPQAQPEAWGRDLA